VGTPNGNIFRYNGTTTLQPVSLRLGSTPPIGISDRTRDAKGNLYLTDQAAEFLHAPTGVYKMATDGSITLVSTVLGVDSIGTEILC
jgi:hypothetical protein